jgi:hypothetical protein
MKTIGTFSGWDIVSGVDTGHVWGIDSSINYGYPFLQGLFSNHDHYGVRVSASADDGYKNGSWDYTFGSIFLGNLSSSYASAVRFLNIPITSGIVVSAFLNIIYNGDFDFGDDIGPADVRIYGIYENNTANFTTDPTSRTKTTAYVDWRIELKEGTEQELISPDLSAIIEEIVNKVGWDANNAIGFIIQDNSSTQYAPFFSYDGSTTKAAYLEISYLGITNRTKTFVSISRIINPDRDYGIKIIKPTFELLTDDDPSHQIFNSDFNTLKYFTSGSVQVVVPSDDLAAKEVFTHSLEFFPYIEVYCRFDDVGDAFVYCPAEQNGATVTIQATYRITENDIEFIVNTGGIASEITVTFKYFIFKNDLGL